jgi:hypothetical protein
MPDINLLQNKFHETGPKRATFPSSRILCGQVAGRRRFCPCAALASEETSIFFSEFNYHRSVVAIFRPKAYLYFSQEFAVCWSQ